MFFRINVTEYKCKTLHFLVHRPASFWMWAEYQLSLFARSGHRNLIRELFKISIKISHPQKYLLASYEMNSQHKIVHGIIHSTKNDFFLSYLFSKCDQIHSFTYFWFSWWYQNGRTLVVIHTLLLKCLYLPILISKKENVNQKLWNKNFNKIKIIEN